MFRGIVKTGVALGVVLWLLVIVSLFVSPAGTSYASKTTSAVSAAP
jgi:hypothetical protein